MYSLKEFLIEVGGMREEVIRSDSLFCLESNTEITLLTNSMQETLAGYSYTVVLSGWLTLQYNGRNITLHEDDLYIYSPGFQINIVDGSPDYRSICLICDDRLTFDTPAVRHIIRTAYYPATELGQPVLHLAKKDAQHMTKRMREIIDYQNSCHRFLEESLRTLYGMFLLDLLDLMEQSKGTEQPSERSAELFVKFMHLLPLHFIDHHDIAFYADQLCISSTHLSRIVRQITGRTVLDYINQLILMEASWLLKSTDMSISEVASRLNFADQSSFTKFFTRLKGITPKQYRR